MVFSEMPKNRGGLTFVRKYEVKTPPLPIAT